MKMLLLKPVKVALLTVVVLVPFQAMAEPSDKVSYSTQLTLHQLTEQVYQQLPGKLAEANFTSLQQANADLAGALFAEPAVANLSHFNDAIGSGDGFQEWEGSVNLPLWLPGQQQQQQKLANSIEAQLPAYQQKLKLDASGQVRQVIWAVKLAEAALEQAELVWHTAQELEHDVTVRVSSGDMASSEALLVANNTLDSKVKVLAAQAELNQELKRYQQLTQQMNLPTNYQETLAEQSEVDEQHPYLVMQDQLIAMLQSQQNVAQYQDAVNPNLSVGVRRERGGFGESFTHSLGVGVSIALNDARYRQPAIAEAAAAVTDAQIQRQELLRELKSQQLFTQTVLSSKQQQLELVAEQDKTAQAYYQSQKRAFDLGEINLSELLRGQAMANEVHSQKQQLQIEVFKAICDVNQSIGVVL